jgi:hypothetical protein
MFNPLVLILAKVGEQAAVQKLQPFTTVTLVKTEAGWALIAKDGKPPGYVAADKLHTLQ